MFSGPRFSASDMLHEEATVWVRVWHPCADTNPVALLSSFLRLFGQGPLHLPALALRPETFCTEAPATAALLH